MQPFQTIPNIIATVSELTFEIKELLEQNFFEVMVSGEVSMPKQSSNGHVYFTLKDDKAQLPCVMWRSSVQSAGFVPKHGDQIICGGQIQLYAPHGRYQMIVNFAQASGAGALQARFEQLKSKLQSEGLFDSDRKKQLPRYPRRIGVVTSKTSAAFQDICQTVEKRWPLARIAIYHAATQGDAAAGEITRAIKFLDDSGKCDVIIAGRGGGSLEDLWPFNEEIVARVIANAKTPIISAVGHETDFTIADFVADVRAATPTQAAVLATPDKNDILLGIEDMQNRGKNAVMSRFRDSENMVNRLKNTHGLKRVPDNINRTLEQIKFFRQKKRHALEGKLNSNTELLLKLGHKLDIRNPEGPLKIGYTRVMQDGKWIKKSSALDAEMPIDITWQDGKVSFGRSKS